MLKITLIADFFEAELGIVIITPAMLEVAIKSARGWCLPINNPNRQRCSATWETHVGFG